MTALHDFAFGRTPAGAHQPPDLPTPAGDNFDCSRCGEAVPPERTDRYCAGCRSAYMKAWRARQWRAPGYVPRPPVRRCSTCSAPIGELASSYCRPCHAAYHRAYRARRKVSCDMPIRLRHTDARDPLPLVSTQNARD